MNSLPLLITYYNNIPSNALNYFSISNGNIIVSKYDMMNTICSSFMNNVNNNLVYIFNGANMGFFSINSLLYSDQNSNTYSINLNSIPINLSDNILCALSITAPIYNITRTYVSKMINNDNINNFTITDSNKFIINTHSYSDVSSTYNKLSNNTTKTVVDDTLFLYIIATHKSFNIIFDSISTHTITNVTIQPSTNTNLASLTFFGNFQVLNFTEKIDYTIYISTENSSTISNIIFNNTPIKPLNYSDIDLSDIPNLSLTHMSPTLSNTPSNSIKITPIKINQKLVSNIVSLNKLASNHVSLNKCVILNIINPSYHKLSGYLSISPLNAPSSQLNAPSSQLVNIQENYSNIPVNNMITSGISNFGSFISESTRSVTVNTYKTFLDNTYIDHSNVMNSIDSVSKVGKNIYDTVSYGYKVAKVNNQDPVKPDNINNISILSGIPCILNVSYYDINNNQIDFITPNIIIYLSNKLRTILYSINSRIDNVSNPNSSSILSFNGELNSVSLPNSIETVPYVISTGPITSYLTYSYDVTKNTGAVINNGSFSYGLMNDTLIINNLDFNSIDAIPFISLLYTIINTDITLNILNMDYSFACSLIVTSVALGKVQSTISINLKSGKLPTDSSNRYFLTLLQTTDIITSVNNKKIYKDVLIKNNELIIRIQNAINRSNLNYPNDPNIQQAEFIITNASNQSILLLNIPFINNNTTTLQITNAIITMAFNAINYALLGDPDSDELQNLYITLIQLSNPVIAKAILNNALYHVNIVINKNSTSDKLSVFTDTRNAINDAINKISSETNSDNISIINTALNQINNALIIIPDNVDLLKAQAILITINLPKNKPKKIESLENYETQSNYLPTTFQIMCGFLICIIFISSIAYIINEEFTKKDKQFFTSENSTNDSSSSL